jgi:hypothetical protein
MGLTYHGMQKNASKHSMAGTPLPLFAESTA